jgi:hypothetical protein
MAPFGFLRFSGYNRRDDDCVIVWLAVLATGYGQHDIAALHGRTPVSAASSMKARQSCSPACRAASKD